MFTLKLENESGGVITLTEDQNKYQVIGIEGLNPPKSNIFHTEVSGMDGSKMLSSKLETRNIVITVKINGNVEKNRINLYNYAKSKHYCKVWYKNGMRDVYIEGWVESNECNLFSESEQMQISIICPDPYFQSAHEIVTDVSMVLGAFEFPFAYGSKGIEHNTITDDAIDFSIYMEDRIVNIINDGEEETGINVKITATGSVTNPTIYNVDTREYFKLNIGLIDGDILSIDTNRGHKSVKLSRGVDTTNVINKVIRNSTWLQLNKGDNLITYDADEGVSDMLVIFTHRSKYQAV